MLDCRCETHLLLNGKFAGNFKKPKIGSGKKRKLKN